MRKIVMIALVLVMMLSAVCVVSAATATDIYTIKGNPTAFWAASWHEGNGNYANIYKHYWLDRGTYGAGGAAALASGSINAFKNMPDGRHSIIVNPTGTDLHHTMVEERENWVYWDIGVAKLSKIMEEYGVELKKQGGQLDWIVGDMEAGFSCYHIELDQSTSPWHADPPDEVLPRYDAIVKDPRWPEIKAILTDMGFVWPKDPNINPLYYVCYRDPAKFPKDGSEFNYLIFNRMSAVIKRINLNKCIWEPIKKSFPNVKYADYSYNEIDVKWRHINGSGEKEYQFKNASNISPYPNSGSHASPNTYACLYPRVKTNPPPQYPWNIYARTRFNGLRHNAIRMFTSYLTPGDQGPVTPVVPYVGYYTFQESDLTRISNNDYWAEAIYHPATLIRPNEPFFYWNPYYAGFMPSLDEENDIFQQVLAEISEMIGFDDRKPLMGPQTTVAEMDAKWVHRYLLTGVYAGGRNVYRFTVDDTVPGLTSLKDVIVSNSPLKLRVANEVIEFPKGYKIVTPSNPFAVNVGMWIVGPKDTFPTEYVDKNKKPAPCPDDQIADTKGVTPTYFIPSVYDNPKDNPNKADVAYGAKLETPLKDIADTTYEGFIAQLYIKGIVKGDQNQNFNPKNNLTRVELLAMLLRASGINEDAYKGDFADVKQSDWFAGVVQAAVNKGISKGIGGGLFDPLSNVTREQIAVFLAQAYKNAEKKTDLLSNGATEAAYTDKDQISTWATQAVNEASTLGLLQVTYNGTTFGPKEKVTREEAASMICNLILVIQGKQPATAIDIWHVGI